MQNNLAKKLPEMAQSINDDLKGAIDQHNQTKEALKPFLSHAKDCDFHSSQQYSSGLDGQDVDCSCGLIDAWSSDGCFVPGG